jgi:murein DD-endopeptidase MepM/ murein hydrolase activator NlpD
VASFILAIAAVTAACWVPPVDAPVTDVFRLPSCRWCAGNRGLEYGTTPGGAVRAVESGVVSFAGSVAGVRYVVVTHADGLRATYGRMATVSVRSGSSVATGERLGSTGAGFYFGLRDAETPIDPAPRLGRWVRRARLVPIDGSPRRSMAPRLVCRNPDLGR